MDPLDAFMAGVQQTVKVWNEILLLPCQTMSTRKCT